MKVLIAVPVYNEAQYVEQVIRRIQAVASDVLVVDDGSTDSTPQVLHALSGIQVVRHEQNQGYGAALRTAFKTASAQGYDWVVTIDSDGQHDPHLIHTLLRHTEGHDIVSGSRYLESFDVDNFAPADRRAINRTITRELNEQFGLMLTDAFCGFKAYRVTALERLTLSHDGYAMPLQLWVQAANAQLRITEVAVPRIYLDESRSFGNGLDDANVRLKHYREVIRNSQNDFDSRGLIWSCDDFPLTGKSLVTS